MIKKLIITLIIFGSAQCLCSEADKHVPMPERLKFIQKRNKLHHDEEMRRIEGQNNNNINNNNRVIKQLPEVNKNTETYGARPIFHKKFVESNKEDRQRKLDEILKLKKQNNNTNQIIENNNINTEEQTIKLRKKNRRSDEKK